MRVVYQALIESIVNYGISIWRGIYKTTRDLLKKIQNKKLKNILKNTQDTTQITLQQYECIALKNNFIKHQYFI